MRYAGTGATEARAHFRRTLGCGGVLVAVVLLAAAVAWADSQLVDSALSYCFGDLDAGEALAGLVFLGGRWLLFMAVFLCGALLLAGFRALGRRADGSAAVAAFRVGFWVTAALLAVVPAGLILYAFATTGTPTGAAGLNCGVGNVPPWWPGWLPS
ncbi:hypothetical protein ACIBUQ_00175 [Nonomuraea sp. NPDC049377]|uniref:hypothetical protein n=1 Tax=Nonomuraea sp. NPDC049377 TaxID=3364351 RepID=UPI0037BB03E2